MNTYLCIYTIQSTNYELGCMQLQQSSKTATILHFKSTCGLELGTAPLPGKQPLETLGSVNNRNINIYIKWHLIALLCHILQQATRTS